MAITYLQCKVNEITKKRFDAFILRNGYPSMMYFILEASFLYLYHNNLFKKYNTIPKEEANDKKFSIAINSIKNYYVIEKFNELAKKNYRNPTQEYSLFIYRLSEFISDHDSLLVPEIIFKHYNEHYLKELLPKIRNKKYVVDFYNLTELIVKKGLHFTIDVTSFCQMISVVLPEDIMKFNYRYRIYQRISPFSKITGMKFRCSYKDYPLLNIKIEYPYIKL